MNSTALKAALDATPDDWEARLVLADAYAEEAGGEDWRTAAHRWMATERRLPYPIPESFTTVCGRRIGPCFLWSNYTDAEVGKELGETPDRSQVPPLVFANLYGGSLFQNERGLDCRQWFVAYPTHDTAFAALAFATDAVRAYQDDHENGMVNLSLHLDRFPDDTGARSKYADALQARWALQQGDKAAGLPEVAVQRWLLANKVHTFLADSNRNHAFEMRHSGTAYRNTMQENVFTLLIGGVASGPSFIGGSVRTYPSRRLAEADLLRALPTLEIIDAIL